MNKTLALRKRHWKVRPSGLLWGALKFLLAFVVACIMLYPFWWMLTGAFKSALEISELPPTFFPREPTLENFDVIFGQADVFGQMYINSIIIAIAVPLLQTIVCLPAAYAFAKLRFPGKNIVFMAFMGSMMLPGQLTIITNNITMVDLKLVNNLMSVILLSIFSAFAIFMMKQYFMNLPKDLDDAAKIDGCSIWGAFLFVDVPLAMPIVSVNLILCFNSAWGGFFLPMIFLRKMEVMTVPLGMTVLQGAYNTESKAVLVAALMLSIVPVVIIFFLFRKQLIAGIATSGLKV